MSDSISRQDAIRWVKTECNPYGKPTLDFESGKKVIEHLEQMPSADKPTGEWVEKDGECVCSECGNSVSFSWTEDGWVLGKFCQTCGVKMVQRNGV